MIVLRLLALTLLVAPATVLAGGGVVLKNDRCIITIGFYEAHFTAYQPRASGDREFCEDLPDTGTTIFVLDYLHGSLKTVPVDMRIIENVTGKGEFARPEDVAALADLEPYTVFYQPPVVRENGSFQVEYEFAARGEYVGIVTAGHPTSEKVYTSVFPFRVGRATLPWALIGLAAALIAAGGLLLTMQRIGKTPPVPAAGESA